MTRLNKYCRVIKGMVVKLSMKKTAVVLVTRKVKHKCYGKIIKKHKKYYAHDEKNLSSLGDIVMISESKPISKTKKWRLKDIIIKSKQ